MIQKATADFINLYQSELGKWDDKRIAYEKAELEWIELHGNRKHTSYKVFTDLLRRLRSDPDRLTRLKRKTVQSNRFFEIYSYVADPYNYVYQNYELAEVEYAREYGTRRFKNYGAFLAARVRYHQTRQRLTT